MKANLQPSFGAYLDTLEYLYHDMIHVYRICYPYKQRLLGIDEDFKDWIATATLDDLDIHKDKVDLLYAQQHSAHLRYAQSEYGQQDPLEVSPLPTPVKVQK